jgi:hypothetical protein
VAWDFDAANTGITETDADSTVTVPHTMGVVINGILFSWIAYQTTSTSITNCTYNGATGTLAVQQTTNRRTALFYFIAPPAGASNIVIAGSSTFGRVVSGSHSWAGANAIQNLTGKTASASGTGLTPSIDVPTEAGELVIDVLGMAFGAGDVLAPNGDQTQRGFLTGGATTGASSSQLGDDGGVMSWTNTDSRAWGQCGASFAPASVVGGIVHPIFGNSEIQGLLFGGKVVR